MSCPFVVGQRIFFEWKNDNHYPVGTKIYCTIDRIIKSNEILYEIWGVWEYPDGGRAMGWMWQHHCYPDVVDYRADQEEDEDDLL